MSESPPAVPEDQALGHVRPPFIETVYFEEWEPLGGPVALSLSPRCTVLVGRNGGGKSLLLEGIRDGARGATFLSFIPRALRLFGFRVDIRDGSSLLHYRYSYKAPAASSRENRGSQTVTMNNWRELCWTHDPEQPLWRVENGVLVLGPKEKFPLGFGGALRSVEDGTLPDGQAADSIQTITALLLGADSIDALMPVRESGRGPIMLNAANGAFPFRERDNRVDYTALTLADDLWELFEEDKEEFEELCAVGQRIGIWQTLAIERYVKEPRGSAKDLADALVAVTVDGVNLGQVSDGTLRLLKILLTLVATPHSHAPLLIDEPELGIHPSLLGALLAEFEAYGAGRQLVIATHSPQVVSWARPDALRLVERVDGRTVVRSLTAEQAERVHSYLQDQGNLGEFVYGGGVDD